MYLRINGDYVYVTEKEASHVSVFSLDGQLVSHIGEGYLQSPCGITVDLDGFVWVCDWEKEAVLMFCLRCLFCNTKMLFLTYQYCYLYM